MPAATGDTRSQRAEAKRNMKKLETAVIGYGKVAHIHAEALASLPESEFVAVCGRDAGKARAFAASRPHTATNADSGIEASASAWMCATLP